MKFDTPDESAPRDIPRAPAAGPASGEGHHHLPMITIPASELTHAEALEAQIVNLPSSAILVNDRNA